MGAVELVVTDLDGTLWFGHERTHPATVAAWRELERRGIPILVAPGRRVTSTRNPLAGLGFAPPAVMLNGAIAMDLATGARFHSHQYPAADASRVLAAFHAVGVEPCVYVDHPTVDVYVGDHPSTHPDHLASLGATAEWADLDEVVELGARADVRDPRAGRIASRSRPSHIRWPTARRASRRPTSTAGSAAR